MRIIPEGERWPPAPAMNAKSKAGLLSDRPSSDTTAAPFQGILLVFFISCAFITIGVVFPPLLVVGALALVLAVPVGMFVRKGPCPNCAARVICLAGSPTRCRDCKHRLVIRSKRLVDVT